jgi:hypothetical protein
MTALVSTSCGGGTEDRSTTPRWVATAPSTTASTAPRATATAPNGPAVGADARPEVREIDRAYDAVIAEKLQVMEKARGLKAKAPVRGRVLTRTEMMAEVKRNVLRDVPLSAIVAEGYGMKLSAVLPVSMDYQDIAFGLLEEELAGFYSPQDSAMVLAKDMPPAGLEVTLLHELTHALQDQTWDMKQYKYAPGQGDQTFARSALAEGDAVRAMVEPALSRMPLEAEPMILQSILDELNSKGDKPSKVPMQLRRSLVAPYVYGLRFVTKLRSGATAVNGEVRTGWDAVNQAWERMPQTSQQILHIEKWATGFQPRPIAAPGRGNLPMDFLELSQDGGGELGLALTLEEAHAHDVAFALAEAWDGDRGVLWGKEVGKNDVEIASVDVMRLRDTTATAKVAEGLMRVAVKLGDGENKTKSTPSFRFVARKTEAGAALKVACIERSTLGPQAIGFLGRRVIRVMGRAKVQTATTSGKAKETWTSLSNCTEATAQVERIAEDLKAELAADLVATRASETGKK